MEQTAWRIPDIFSDNISALEKAGYSRLLSAVLYTRGLTTPELACAHLSRDRALLSDPFTLTDMDRAVARLRKAISQNEIVAVYGDYDVDGITSSCLLYDCLTRQGLDCRIYIPDRIDEGYGLNPEALEALRQQGVGLVVTVDCGITAADDIEFAKSIGLDIIITDHHECPPVLPDCCGVINPKRHDSAHPSYNLAGVGVALKLACALEESQSKALELYSDLVAIGTIADVMPLTGENRVLAHLGIEKLKSAPRPGLAALLQEAGAGDKPITTSVVGYILAPRINAAGRLCETSKSIELLLCGDTDKAQEYAAELCALNRKRQDLETEVWRNAAQTLKSAPPRGPIVLASELWHPGVVGIAASRLAEEYRLPAIIICLDGENGKGSCRSFGSFNLFDGLKACSQHLDSFGGHAFAAGINIKRDKIDTFREALSRYYAENTPEISVGLMPELRLSDLSDLTIEDVESLDELEPCGAENPKPLMCICGVAIESVSAIGGGRHLRINIAKNGQSMGGVFFSRTLDEIDVEPGTVADICFTPQINEFRARKNVQLLIAGIRPSEQPSLYRSFLESSELSPDIVKNSALSRDELVGLWRSFRACGGSCRISFAELMNGAALEGMDPVKTCLGVKVFEELKLLTLKTDRDHFEIEIDESGEKVQLENSSLFRQLSKNCTTE